MEGKMTKKKKLLKIVITNEFLVLLIFVSTLFLSMGYAAINSIVMNLDGSAYYAADKTLHISTATSSHSDSTINSFSGTMLNSTVNLTNHNTETFTITIFNNTNEDYMFDQVLRDTEQSLFYDNQNITFTLSGINKYDQLNHGQSKTFTITFSYVNGFTPSSASDKILNSYINFRFKKGYSVTYNNITTQNNSNYPTTVLENDSLIATFSNDVPYSVKVTMGNNVLIENTDYTYTTSNNNKVLTVNNVTNNVVIDRYYQIVYNLDGGTNNANNQDKYLHGASQTLLAASKTNATFDGWYDNPSFTGNAITSTSGKTGTLTLYAKWLVNYSVTYVDITGSGNYTNTAVGGTTFTLTFTTPPSGVSVTMGGNTLTENVGYTYSNGVITIPNVSGNIVITGVSGNTVVEDNTTTTYDPDNIPPSTTVTYNAISGHPRVETDDSGNITSFEYTNSSSSNPVQITSSTPVSTGFVPFASNTNWELNMTFRYSSEDNGSASAATTVGILGCVSYSGTQINSGFAFRFYNFKYVSANSATYKYNGMLKYRSSIWKEKDDGSTTQVLYGLFNTNGSGMIGTSPMTYSVHVTKVGNTVTFTLTNLQPLVYNPTANNNNSVLTAAANTNQTISWTDTGVSNSVDITIGGYLNNSGSIDRKADMDVYSFEVHKTN